ncbi:MAG: hypothetical protein IJA60_01785 [Clostridia bacterium]|nr:hypothetical protein [Clostridia bacterium]
MASTAYYKEKIANASSKSEIIAILKEMKADLGENNPDVQEIVKKMGV